MKLSSVVKVSEGESPKIIGEHEVQMKVHPGETVVLHCDAFTNDKDDVTLIYWLIDDFFPEDIYSNGRIVESEEETLAEGLILQKSLLLMNVTAEDFTSNFTCIVTNTSGMAQKQVTLSAPGGSHVGKRRKH